MVAREGGYYGNSFKGFRGVIQGEPLSLTMLYVVVDAVVWHWVEEMVESAGGQGGRGREGRHQDFLFYVDDGMLASSDPGWMHGAFSTLVGMFAPVGLRKNVRKTVKMVCCLCQAAGTQSEVAYEHRMTGAVLSYQERQGGRVQCLE